MNFLAPLRIAYPLAILCVITLAVMLVGCPDSPPVPEPDPKPTIGLSSMQSFIIDEEQRFFFFVWNPGDENSVLHWTLTADNDWILLDTTRGTSAVADERIQVNVTIDWDGLSKASHSGSITVSSSDAGVSSKVVTLVVEDPVPPAEGEGEGEGEAPMDQAVYMRATEADDANGVEYYFEEVTGNPGGDDSGWQDSSDYTDTGLAQDTVYTYRVKYRDKSPVKNVTEPSVEMSVTTGSE